MTARVRQKENIQVRHTDSARILQQEHGSKTEDNRRESLGEDDLNRIRCAYRSRDESKSEA